MAKLNLMALGILLGGSAFSLASCGPKLDKSVIVDCSAFAGWTQVEAFLTGKAHSTCGRQDADGMLYISPQRMKLFPSNFFEHDYGEWGQKGLKCLIFLFADEGLHFGYLAPDGRARISNNRQGYPYDSNCQPFRNDVAISYVDGKAVFFDKDLKVVKATEYELADSFYKHLAKVCTVRPEKEFYGQHSFEFEWVGGTCGYIDTDFNVVVPIETPYESTNRLTGGKYDGVELNQWEQSKLDFLVAALPENSSPFEMVFKPSGCHLKYCTEEKKRALKIPTNLEETEVWVTTLHFRLEDQTLWEGHVISNRERDLTLHRLAQIERLPASSGL